MGEVFKGLTIKIGADTTNVKLHLKDLNNTLKSTQKNLRTIEQALKFDPASVSNLSNKFKLTRESITAMTTQLSLFRRQMNEIASVVGIEKIRAEMGNVTTTLANARAAVKTYDGALENVYLELKEIAAEHGIAFDKDKTDIPKLIATLETYGHNLTELKTKWEQLRAAQKLATEERDTLKLVSDYKNLAVNVDYTTAKIKNMASSLSTSTSYVGKLTAEMKQSAAGAKTMDEYMSQLGSKVRTASTAYSKLATELKSMEARLESVSKKEKAAFESEYAQKQAQVIDTLKTKVQALTERYNALEVAAGKFSSETTDFVKLAQTAETLKGRLTAVETEIGEISSKLLDASSRLKTFEAAGDTISADFKATQTEVAELSSRLQAAEENATQLRTTASQVRAAFEMSAVNAELNNTKAALESVNGAAKSATSAMRSLGITLTATVSAAAYMFFFRAAEAAQELDEAYRNMRKTVNATETAYENLYKAAVKYGETHITSAAEILEIEALGGQLGIAADQLENFATTVSNLDIAIESVDSDELAESLGRLSNQFQWADGDMEKFGDALTRLGNNMPTTEDKIISITGRLSSMSSIVGMSTTETLAWATALASTTQGAESAATGLSKTMSKIETAVANGGDMLQSFADIAGMSAESFAAAWESSPSDALHAFILGLKEINNEGGSVDATLQSLGITSVRQKESIQNLVQTIDTLDDALMMSSDAWNGVSDQWGDAGDAANEAAKKSEGFSGALTTLENAASVTGATIMESVTPVLQAAATVLAGLNDIITPMPSIVKEMIVAFAGISIITGPILNLVAGVSNFANTSKKAAAQATVLQRGVAKLKAAVESSTVAQKANTAAVETNTTAEKANATATELETTASKKVVAAVEASTAAEKLNTAAVETNTTAEKTNVKATETLVAATKTNTKAVEASSLSTKAYSKTLAALDSSFVTAAASSKLLNTALKTIVPVAIFTGAVEVINALSEAISSAAKAGEELTGISFDELNEDISTFKANLEDINDSYESSVGTAKQIEKLANQYFSLAAATGKTADSSTELYGIQAQLASLSGELADSLFEDGKAVEYTASAVMILAKNQADAIMQKAGMQKLSDMYGEYTSVAAELKEVEEAIAAEQERVNNSFNDSYYEAGVASSTMQALTEKYNELAEILEELGYDIEELTEDLSAQELQSQLLDEAIEQMAQGLMTSADAVEYINERMEASGYSGEEYATTLQEVKAAAGEAASSLEDDYKDALETLESEIEEVISGNALLGQAFDQAGIDAGALAENLNALGMTAEDFANSVTSDMDEVINSFGRLEMGADTDIKALKDNLDANANDMSNWLDNLAFLMEYAKENNLEGLAEIIEQWKEAGPESAGGYVSTAVEELRNGNTEILNSLNETMESSIAAMEEGEAEYAKAAGAGIATSISNGVNEQVENLNFDTSGQAIVTSLATSAQEYMEAGFSPAATALMMIADQNITAIALDGSFTESGAAIIQAVADAAGIAAAEVLPSVGADVVTGYGNGIAENTSLVNEPSAAMGQASIDATRDSIGAHSPAAAFIDIGMDAAEGFAKGLENGAGLAKGAAQTMAQGFVSAFSSVNGTTLGAQLAAQAVAGLQSKTGQARAAGTTTATNYNTGLSSKNGTIRSTGVTAGNNYVTGLSTKYGTAQTNGKTLATRALTGTKSNASQFKTAGTTAGGNFVTGIQSKWGSAQSAGSTLASRARSGMSSVGSGYSIGRNFGLSYANGISSTSGRVYSAAYSIARQAVAAANAAQKSGSPSKEMIKAGKWFGEGYEQGIDSQISAVKDTAAEMAENAISAASLGSDFITGFIDGMETQQERLRRAAENTAAIVNDAFSATSWQRASDYATYAMYSPVIEPANTQTAVNVNVEGQLTRDDVYNAVVSALKMQQTKVDLNIDGRAFASAVATSQDSVQGRRQSLVGRGLAL